MRSINSILTFAILLWGLASCSTQEEMDGPVGYPDLYISTAASPIQSDVHASVDNNHELIHDYMLVYVNTTTRRVEAIRNFVAGSDAVEYNTESFPIEITEADGSDRHAYRVYAFANFTPTMKSHVSFNPGQAGYTLSDLSVGKVLPANYESLINSAKLDLTEASVTGVADYNGYDFAGSSSYVPMTAVVDYLATMQYHQPINVPLVRMLARLEFKVCNLSGADVKLQSITVQSITDDEVYLLPHIATRTTEQADAQATSQAVGYYPARPAADAMRYVPQLPSATPDTTHVTLTQTGGMLLTDYSANPTSEERFKTFGSLYVNESTAKQHPTKHFAFNLLFTLPDGTQREYRYALSGNDFTSFCRNDRVIIPLTISDDYSLEPEVYFYPPIGGYPAVIDRKEDNEFYCYFGTEGDFAIYPRLYRNGKDTGILLSDVSVVESKVVSIEHLEGSIFSKTPEYVVADNAILGAVGGSLGHAVVTLQVTMTQSGRILTKKVHIIRE